MIRRLSEVLYFVPDRRKAADWFAELFETDIVLLDDNPEYFYLQVGPQQVWFHLVDEKGPAGPGGQTAYWQVDDLDATLQRARNLGAELYRGPLDRADGSWMCQVKTPFNSVIGLVGPRQASEENVP